MRDDRPRWDPRTQGCVPVLTTGGHGDEVPLVTALAEADQIRTVCGATPGETIAVMEYLLGIIHASGHVPRHDDDWAEWVMGARSLAPAAKWLGDDDPERWDLFHPDHPLGQNALLAPWLDEHGVGTAQLVIEHAADYNQVFDHKHLHHPEPLAPAAAFRAMLTQHVYGLSGRAKGDTTWLGKNLLSLAAGRLRSRVRVLACGETLGDTLRLNLTPGKAAAMGTFNYSWTSGRHRRVFTGPKEDAYRPVDGPADLHSMLGRSILLRPALGTSGELIVDRVLVNAGELLTDSARQHEHDTVVETTTNSKGETVRTILKASEHRALWRNAHALYAAVADNQKGTDLYDRLALLGGRRTTLWAVGLVAMQTKGITWVADSFPTIPGRETDLLSASRNGLQIVEYAAKALYFAADTARKITYPNAKPADRKDHLARFNAAPDLYADAAEPFHSLLDDVADGTETDHALTAYAARIHTTTTRALGKRLESLPRNGTGYQARAEAVQKLHSTLTQAKTAPHYLKEAARGRPDA